MDGVFLDAHILFSAAHRPDTGLRRLWEVGDIQLITSIYAGEKARRNLDQPEQRADLEALLQSVDVLVATPGDPPVTVPTELAEKDRRFSPWRRPPGRSICSPAMCGTAAVIAGRRRQG